jgi:uncharacterized protein (TIGR02284 family)
MEDLTETIEVLNDLIRISNDRIMGYEKAIRETRQEDTDLKILYAAMVAESHRMKIALASEVQVLGGKVEQGTTLEGKVYRGWMELKGFLTGHDRQAILANCETGEEAAQRAYELALDHVLPAYIREMLNRQHTNLYTSLEEIRAARGLYA